MGTWMYHLVKWSGLGYAPPISTEGMPMTPQPPATPGLLGTVKLPITAGIVAAIMALGLTVAFHLLLSYRPTLIFLAAALGGAATVTSGYYAAEALARTTRLNAEAQDTRRLLAAFDYVQRWNAPAFSETRK